MSLSLAVQPISSLALSFDLTTLITIKITHHLIQTLTSNSNPPSAPLLRPPGANRLPKPLPSSFKFLEHDRSFAQPAKCLEGETHLGGKKKGRKNDTLVYRLTQIQELTPVLCPLPPPPPRKTL